MDSLITAAARALAAGDPLGALNRIALRDDAPALALRGIAMAQLGDLERAKVLVRRAALAFGTREVVAHARCVLAQAEIALVTRDLGWPENALEAARKALEAHGDRANAAFAWHLQIRRMLLLGHLDEAEDALSEFDPTPLAHAAKAVHELVIAGLAMRRIRTDAARTAFARADAAARSAGIPALTAEVERARLALNAPAARLVRGGEARPLVLQELEALFESDALIVDGCRHAVRGAGTSVSLARRPILFELVRTLAEAWPAEASRSALIRRAFRSRIADESHRARLRVEMGRLRSLMRPLAGIRAVRRGFVLEPRKAPEVLVLARPIDEEHAAVLALLADGEWWSSSALALTLGTSQRTVQRALASLAEAGKVQSLGRGRTRRWSTPPITGITTALLLPGPLPEG